MEEASWIQIMDVQTYIVGVDILIRNCMNLCIEALGQLSLLGRVLCKFPRVRNSVRMHYFMYWRLFGKIRIGVIRLMHSLHCRFMLILQDFSMRHLLRINVREMMLMKTHHRDQQDRIKDGNKQFQYMKKPWKMLHQPWRRKVRPRLTNYNSILKRLQIEEGLGWTYRVYIKRRFWNCKLKVSWDTH